MIGGLPTKIIRMTHQHFDLSKSGFEHARIREISRAVQRDKNDQPRIQNMVWGHPRWMKTKVCSRKSLGKIKIPCPRTVFVDFESIFELLISRNSTVSLEVYFDQPGLQIVIRTCSFISKVKEEIPSFSKQLKSSKSIKYRRSYVDFSAALLEYALGISPSWQFGDD